MGSSPESWRARSGFLAMSRWSCSCANSWSEVGSPNAFCFWSNIIFETLDWSSLGSSSALSFSGTTPFMSISVSPTTSDAQNTRSTAFLRLTFTRQPSSRFQRLSCTATGPQSSPSMMGAWPLSPTVSRFFCMETTTSFARTATPDADERGTTTSTSESFCVHE
eukprot:Amastigsp_a512543_14.p2 type:complete len:164 gc:universal Amastigsp_a512543_14:499-8(-)